MVIAYHAVWSAYGFWLPNEQRGSWSTEVWAPHSREFGSATKTTEKKSLADRPYDPMLRWQMRHSLKFPAVRFTLAQIESIARGFVQAIDQFDIALHACAIIWDHVHIVSHRHKEPIEFVARILKSAATKQLTRENLHPCARFANTNGRAPTPWADGRWERYLNSESEINDAVRYVNGNPEKHDLPKQNWKFIK